MAKYTEYPCPYCKSIRCTWSAYQLLHCEDHGDAPTESDCSGEADAPPDPPDNCQICHGSKGGVKGNENVINGVIVCDYCHVIMGDEGWKPVKEPAKCVFIGNVGQCHASDCPVHASRHRKIEAKLAIMLEGGLGATKIGTLAITAEFEAPKTRRISSRPADDHVACVVDMARDLMLENWNQAMDAIWMETE